MAASRASAYYRLTKPGIIRGNAITALAGFFVASHGHVDALLGAAMLVGLSLVMASGCVCNNYIDRDIDSKMARTKNRALVNGTISGRRALLFAAVLGAAGVAILVVGTNLLATTLAIFGFIAYVIIYGVAKRRSVHGTIIGSISGAIPPVVGYCAVSGRLDGGALILFLILVCWQMPHFYAIAMYRLQDYSQAGIPVLPAVSGARATKQQITAYIVAFLLAASALSVYDYSGYLYRVITLVVGIIWLCKAAGGFRLATPAQDARWARGIFRFSLIVISVLCLAMSIDSFVPRPF